ncbi:MAG TPA: hypothetical protein VGM25_10360 [Caulobacteraceae bacterium]|jgi:hypothetical protein
MNAPATLPSDAPPSAACADWARPLIERQLQILGRLAEAGLEIAVALEAQARGGPEVVQGDVAMAHARVARAVRQTVMLQSKLIEALDDREDERAARQASVRANAARIVRGVIEDERGDGERAERLGAEAAERLRAEDFGDLLSRPFGEAVAGICRDLGLAPDWLALAEDCFAAEAAIAGRPVEAPAEPEYRGPMTVRWLDPAPDPRPRPAADSS